MGRRDGAARRGERGQVQVDGLDADKDRRRGGHRPRNRSRIDHVFSWNVFHLFQEEIKFLFFCVK